MSDEGPCHSHADRHLTGLDGLDEPAFLVELNNEVAARMPAVDLPEIVLEVNSWVALPERLHPRLRGQLPSAVSGRGPHQ